ncbi:MAG: hypothetical protein K5697_12800 [Lachnospiraceae bacterium]|nr:hypothetical protein [Lachnospiraceae bacterium]
MLDRNGKSYNRLPNGADSSISMELAVDWDRLPLIVIQDDGVYGTPLPAPVYEFPEAGNTATISYEGLLSKDDSVYGPTDVAPSLPGRYTVSVTYRMKGQVYAGAADFVIKKADWADKNIQIYGDDINDGKCDLKNNIAEKGTIGTVTVINGSEQLDGSPHISSGNLLEWKIKETVIRVNVTLSIPVTGADNYNDYSVFVTLSSSQSGELPLLIAQADGVYGVPLSSPEYEKPDDDGTETICYNGTLFKDHSSYGLSPDAPSLPGTYMVNITYETGDAVYAGSAGFEIKKADWSNKAARVRGASGTDGRIDLAKRIAENAALGEITVTEGSEQLDGTPQITGGTILEWKIKINVGNIDILLNIPVTGADNYNDYNISVSIQGESSVPVAEEITVNGNKVSSLKEAFNQITDPGMDYVINIGLDVKEDKNLTIPKTARSVTINGNGHTLKLCGSRITANAPLSLEGININALKKNGDDSKLTLLSKKDLRIGKNTAIESAGTTIKCSGDLVLSASFLADKVTAGDLTLESGAELVVPAAGNITVNGILKGKGGAIKLARNFHKPIKLKGTVEGVICFNGDKQTDGTQLISCSSKKISAELLRESFDVSAVTDNAVDTYLYYFGSGKAVIFGEAISYKGVKYGIWKDAIAAMNADLKAAKAAKKEISFEIELSGDVHTNSNFKLPSKGYKNITVHGNGHSMTFTGNIKLTGNTVFDDIVLNKVDKNGNKKAGKVIRGKYSYDGPDPF